MVLVQTRSGPVSGNMGLPRPETKWSCIFGKIPDQDWDHRVWSGPDWVPIGPGPNFPNTILVKNWKPTLALLIPLGKLKLNSKDFICKRTIKP